MKDRRGTSPLKSALRARPLERTGAQKQRCADASVANASTRGSGLARSGTSTWCDRRPCRARAASRSAGSVPSRPRAFTKRPVWTPPSRTASAIALRRCRCRRSSSSRSSSPGGRFGDSWARHSTSSASRLPMPATCSWSSSCAFSGAVPRPTRSRNSAGLMSAASGPTCVKSGSRTARPRRRLSCSARRPPVLELDREPVPVVRSGLSVDDDLARPCRGAARAPGPRRRPSPPRGTCRAAARAVSVRPGAGPRRAHPARAGGRRRCRRRRPPAIVRPSAFSICSRARSASGSSGTTGVRRPSTS